MTKLAQLLGQHSVSEWTNALGVERSTVTRWKRGEREPTARMAIAIAEAAGLKTVAELKALLEEVMSDEV